MEFPVLEKRFSPQIQNKEFLYNHLACTVYLKKVTKPCLNLIIITTANNNSSLDYYVPNTVHFCCVNKVSL